MQYYKCISNGRGIICLITSDIYKFWVSESEKKTVAVVGSMIAKEFHRYISDGFPITQKRYDSA